MRKVTRNDINKNNMVALSYCVTGYNVPYQHYSDEQIKKELIELENKARQADFGEYEILKNSFFNIFE